MAAEDAPTDTPSPVESPSATAASGADISHVLFRHRAYPLADQTRIAGGDDDAAILVQADASLLLHREGNQWYLTTERGTVTVNGQPSVPGQALVQGDLIMLAGSGEVLQLITVIGADGP